MKKAAVAACIVLASIASLPASADWSGKGRIGGVLVRGNSDTATANLDFDVTKHLERWDNKLGGSMLRTLNAGVVSANRWEARIGSDYRPTDRAFFFMAGRYEQDEFTDYAYQATATLGVGYHFVANDRTKLDGRLGVGGRRAELRLTDVVEEDPIARTEIDFKHQLTGNTSVLNRLLVEAGESNTFVQNALGLEVKMTQRFSLGLSYEVRRNSDVLPGTRNSDQVFTVGLVAALD
jgi:putative salt-induced outer membrane protein